MKKNKIIKAEGRGGACWQDVIVNIEYYTNPMLTPELLHRVKYFRMALPVSKYVPVCK
jgi:hypothetical protein